MAEKTSDEAGFKLKSCLTPKSVFSLTTYYVASQAGNSVPAKSNRGTRGGKELLQVIT